MVGGGATAEKAVGNSNADEEEVDELPELGQRGVGDKVRSL